jgi:hypothetical protein
MVHGDVELALGRVEMAGPGGDDSAPERRRQSNSDVEPSGPPRRVYPQLDLGHGRMDLENSAVAVAGSCADDWPNGIRSRCKRF